MNWHQQQQQHQKPAPEYEDEVYERDDAVIGQALKISLIVFVVIGAAVGGAVWWLRRPTAKAEAPQAALSSLNVREMPPVKLPEARFTDITTEAGITFVHQNGAYGDKLLPETMGGGVAFFDLDGDQDQDILLINSNVWPWDPRQNKPPAATHALYRNDGQGKFEDITAGSGLDVSLYGMGVATADYDGDGRCDVFISTLGKNRLFRNLGDGKFEDVTDAAGVGGAEDAWSTSAGWLDYDGDGDLDLFVCNYVQWSKDYDLKQAFQLTGGGRAYGRPQNFNGTFPYLYRNDQGRFTDVSAEAGIQVRNPATQAPMAKSLGTTFADLDEDGRLDIIVANDMVPNFLFHNEGGGKFREVGMDAGIAFDPTGLARGAMGIDLACFRNDRQIGIAIGNFANEMTALYVTQSKQMQFLDQAVASGLGPNTRLLLTFGILYLDYDLDGRLDIAAANGHLEEEIHRVQSSQYYEQPPQLFWNGGRQYATEFVPVSGDCCGEDFVKPMVGRGAAFADIDGDGDLDILLTASGRAPRLLRNDQKLPHHWLRVRLVGPEKNRDAIGAWVELEAGGQVQRRQVMPTRSYLSQVELPLTFGLGSATTIDRLTVHWPNGKSQTTNAASVDQLLTVEYAE